LIALLFVSDVYIRASTQALPLLLLPLLLLPLLLLPLLLLPLLFSLLPLPYQCIRTSKHISHRLLLHFKSEHKLRIPPAHNVHGHTNQCSFRRCHLHQNVSPQT
jgi:hypothetical protein